MHIRSSSVFFFGTSTGFASQSGFNISLMNPAASNLVNSFLMAAFLSGANHRSFCLMGFEPLLISMVCSANSLGTPGISAGFHAKMSLLSLRKLVSASSYLGSSSELMIAVFSGSPVNKSIFLVLASSAGLKLLALFAFFSGT